MNGGKLLIAALQFLFCALSLDAMTAKEIIKKSSSK
jgi:hypothetical protein